MKNLHLLVKNTLKRLLRDKATIMLILLSLVLPIMFLSFNYADNTQLRIGVVDKDGSNLAKDMINRFESAKRFKITVIAEADVNDKLAEGDLDCALIISDGFEDGIISGNVKRPQVVSLKGQDATAWLKNNIDIFVKNTYDIAKAAKGDRTTFDRMYEGYKKAGSEPKTVMVEDKSVKNIATLRSIGFFIMLLMFGTGSISSLTLKEKKDRTFYRICAAPVRPRTYILSNLIVNTIAMIFQVAVIMILVTRLLKLPFDIMTLQLSLVLVAFGITSIGLNMLINAFSTSTLQSSTMSTLIITPTCMLGGVFWPIDFMPEALRRLSNLMPQKWAIEAVAKLQNGETFGGLAINLLILLAFAAAFLTIAAYKIKVSEKTADFV